MWTRALRLLAIAWTVVIAARYVDTVRKSILNPFNPGSDVEWASIAIVISAVLGLSLLVFRRKAVQVWTGLVFAAGGVFIVASGQLVAAALAVWVLGVATLVGDRCLSGFGLHETGDSRHRVVLAFPIGIICLSLITVFLGLAGFFSTTVVWILFAGLTVAVLPRLYRLVHERKPASKSDSSGHSTEFHFLRLLLALAFLRNLLWSVAPEVEYDALNMRISVPRIFLEQGRVVELPYFWHSYFVHLLEYFHAFCLALHSEAVAKFAVAIIALMAALTIYVLGKMAFSESAGLWSAVLFYTTPLVSWGAATAYNDNAIAQFLAASLIAFLGWYRSRQQGWIIAAGVLAGGAVGIKLNAIFAVLPLFLVVLLVVAGERVSLWLRFRTLLLFATTCFLILLPWYGMVYWWTGNPIFPLLNGVFRSPFWDIDNSLMNAADFGVGMSPGALLRVPFRLTFDSTRFAEALPRGGLGPLLLMFIPFGFAKLRGNRERQFLWIVCCVYLALWAGSFQYGRYYTAIFPLVVILGVGGFLELDSRFQPVSRRLILAVMLVAQLSLLPVLYWRIPERFPVRLALGLESPESLLRRGLFGFRAAEYLNSVVQPGERIVAVGFEDLRFYLKAPLETLSESRLDSHLRREVESADLESAGPRDLSESLSHSGVAYLLFRPQDLLNPPVYYPYAQADFLRDFATLTYSDQEARVYRLHPSQN